MGFWNKFEEGKLWVKVKDNKFDCEAPLFV